MGNLLGEIKTMLALGLLATSTSAFVAPASRVLPVDTRTAVSMSLARRELLQSAGAALALFPALANADGANSAQTAFRARAIYGSRIYRLKSESAAAILAESNAFKLFISGAYRTGDVKPTAVQLTKLSKSILASAAAGEAAAKKTLSEFVAVAKLSELDSIKGGNFDPKQRRNAGAPPTAEIEAQMGTEAYALYTALPQK